MQDKSLSKKGNSNIMKILSVFLIMIGCVLMFLGVSMRAKQHAFTRLEMEVREGNRGTAIAVGASTGALVGGTNTIVYL